MTEYFAALVSHRLHANEAAQSLAGATAAGRPEGVAMNVHRRQFVLNQYPLLKPGVQVVAGTGVPVPLSRDVTLKVAAQFDANDVLKRSAVKLQLQLRVDHVIGRGQDRVELD